MAWPMRSSVRVSGRFSRREIVGCEHNAVSPSSRAMASLNIGSVRNRSASLPSS